MTVYIVFAVLFLLVVFVVWVIHSTSDEKRRQWAEAADALGLVVERRVPERDRFRLPIVGLGRERPETAVDIYVVPDPDDVISECHEANSWGRLENVECVLLH